MMDIENYIDTYEQTKIYDCTYYHDPNRWKEASHETKSAIQGLPWSDYIKYLGDDGKVSKKLNVLPNNAGGLYLFFIQGQTLPSTEMYLAYVGRAYYTEKENIRKRVKRTRWRN